MVSSSFAAVARAKPAIASVAVTYVAFVAIGIGMVRGGTARSWLGLPVDLLYDAARAYVVITPLFLIASLWEFLA